VDTIDVGRLLDSARCGEIGRSEVRLVARAAGELVRRLHDVGFVHADLTPRNMLVERASLATNEPALWIVDLEGARFVSDLGDAERRDNLRRLLRFVDRREERDGNALTRTDYVRFARGYDPEGARWKRDWTAIRSEHARQNVWHRIGWMLERVGGPSDSRARATGTSNIRDRGDCV